MIRKTLSIIIIIIMAAAVDTASAASKKPESALCPGGKAVVGQRKYKLVVNEGNDSSIAEFNRGLTALRGNISNRGILDNLAGLYKSTAAGQAVSVSTSLLDLGISSIINATKSKQPQWEKAVRGESTFVRRLPMQMEILDFYRNPSLNGPLDPTDMNFNGFGCKQLIEYTDDEGNTREEEVFYVSCKVRFDDQGKARMLHHSKFEVYVDTLRFNYAICNLPNDSLSTDLSSRIDFSFDNRTDLRFIVNAKITSSWINQALMVFKDQPLGEFSIMASIDPKYIDDDGVFRYYAGRAGDEAKRVTVSGDCFLVPRSYVGSSDMRNLQDSWGTGQYKVEMNIAETCRIRTDYYQQDGKWDSSKWKPEWKKISSRRRGPSPWRQALGVVASQYGDSKWVTILAEPAKTTFIQFETDGLTHLLNAGPATAGAQSAAKSAQGGKSGDRTGKGK